MRPLSALVHLRCIHLFGIAVALSTLLLGTAAAQFVQLNTVRQSVTFPPTPVGSTSAPVTVPLLISGDGTAITAISSPVSQGNRQEYTVQSIGCALNTPLPAGTICDVSVTFSPRYPGNRSVPLQMTTVAAGNFDFGMQGLGTGPQVALSPAIIDTVAGNGKDDHMLTGDGGSALTAGVVAPLNVAVDSAGNLYIVDAFDNVIRKVAADSGIITTVAGISSPGNGGFGGDGSPALSAQMNRPAAVAVDSAGDLYIADSQNDFIREVSASTGDASTAVGAGVLIGPPPLHPPTGYAGDGGLAVNAILNNPEGLVFDGADNLYFADAGNNVIRRVDAVTDIITTVAGNHKQGYSGDGGPATAATLNNPNAIAVDAAGNLYIADLGNNVVRKVAAGTGIIMTVAGNGTAGYSGDGGSATAAELNYPSNISVDSAGDLYIADAKNSRIREVDASTGIITTVAGNGTIGFGGDGYDATDAILNKAYGIALDSAGNLYIADTSNNRIRKVDVPDSALYFATTPIGFTSLDSPQTATVTNTGNAPLDFSVPPSGLNPTITRDFPLSTGSTCPQLDISSSPAALAPGASCTLVLSFTPVESGPINGTADIADNALSTPAFVQTVHLNATGLPASAGIPDFSLTVTPSTQTIYPGGTAAYTVTVTPIYGFSSAVVLTASAPPADMTGSFSSTSVAAGSSSTFTLVFPQTAAGLTPAENPVRDGGFPPHCALLLFPLPLLGLARLRKRICSTRGKALLSMVVLIVLGIVASGATGCANIGLELEPQTYTLTINGTSGHLQRSAIVTLNAESYVKVKYH